MIKVTITRVAEDIWRFLDVHEGIHQEELFRYLESPKRSNDMLLMALGWLIYQKHVRWVPVEKGGRLYLVSPTEEEPCYEKSNQDPIALNNA